MKRLQGYRGGRGERREEAAAMMGWGRVGRGGVVDGEGCRQARLFTSLTGHRHRHRHRHRHSRRLRNAERVRVSQDLDAYLQMLDPDDSGFVTIMKINESLTAFGQREMSADDQVCMSRHACAS